MKIILDTETCKKNGKDMDLVLYLLSLMTDSKITLNTFEKARQQRLLEFEKMYDPRVPFPEYVNLNQSGEFLIESVLANSSPDTPKSDEELRTLADSLRMLFPKGNKPGYAYSWRDSTSCIVDRLKKFFLKYGKYSNEEIIDATKRYVDSFNGKYQYMQLLKYFIWKNKVTGEEVVRGRIVGEVERQSQLAAYLDNKDDDKNTATDWDVELK